MPRFAPALLVLALSTTHSFAQQPATAEKSPVDELIPWLLNENRELRGIPFDQVIHAATGHRVLAIDRKDETDQRVLKQIGTALDEVVRRMSAPDSPVQSFARINE